MKSSRETEAQIMITQSGRKKDVLAFIGFAVFALLISIGFFWKEAYADFSALSGDQFNILTVCAKKDFPHLLEGDLVAGDPKNVSYYIPVFVNLVRLVSLPDHNYLRGLNILLLATSLLYLFGWWFLFSVWGDRFLAAILAFLSRGIIWPPGNEVWGIAGLWTMLPRTLFLALLPWLLWVWIRRRHVRSGWLTACLLCGLAANIHPISGVGVSAGLMLAEFAWSLAESRSLRAAVLRVALGGAVVFVGLLPFFGAYIAVMGSHPGVDPTEFAHAVRMRVGPIFWDPVLYLQGWLRPQLLVLLILPWIACVCIAKADLKAHRRLLLACGAFAAGCLMTAVLPFAIENLLKRFGHQVSFAWELVRVGKYMIAPSIVVAAMVCTLTARRIANAWRYGRAAVVTVSILVVLLTAVSRHPQFDHVPVIGDDVTRFLWPSWAAPAEHAYAEVENLDSVLKWIRENTTTDTKFVGPRQIRAGALRSVIHDFAGAGMLIEGNPRAFLAAAKREQTLRTPEYRDPVRRGELLASWGADYWVTRAYDSRLRIAYTDRNYFIYDLRGGQGPAASSSNDPVASTRLNPTEGL